MTLQRSGAPLEPGPSPLALSDTNVKINIRKVQEERTRAGARQEVGGVGGGTDNVGESQEGSGRTVNVTYRLVGQPIQVQVPADLRADVSPHGFWKRGTTTIFDI